jgi:hypothetical protein
MVRDFVYKFHMEHCGETNIMTGETFAVYIFKITRSRCLLGWVLLIHVPAFTVSDPSVSQQQNTGHHTMEFFEMCAALITQLAR